jgi:hypothetical protein
MATNPYALRPEIQDIALSLGLGETFGLSMPTPAPRMRPGFKLIKLPDGSEMEIPENPTPDEKMQISMDLASAFPKEYGELLDEYRDVGGYTKEFFKGIPRGLASGAINIAQGAVGLVTPGIDTEAEKSLAALQGYIEQDSAVAADPVYRDTYAAKLGAGLGSFATFAAPGAAARVLGANPFGAGARATTFGMAGASGVGEQASRIMEQRELGKEISAGRELAALAPGLAIGLTEALPVERLFKKAIKFDPTQGSALRNIFARIGKGDQVAGTIYDDIARLMGGALKQGTVEGLQELVAGVAQDTVSRVVYDPDIEIGGSMMDDLLVGGGVGALADVIVDAMGGRRTVANEAYRLREEALRRQRIDRFDETRAQNIARANQQAARDRLAAAAPAALALPSPGMVAGGEYVQPANPFDGVYNVSLASDPDRFMSVPVFTQQGRTFAYNPASNNYLDLTENIAAGENINDVIAVEMGGGVGAIAPSKATDRRLAIPALRKQVEVNKSVSTPFFSADTLQDDINNQRFTPLSEDVNVIPVPLPSVADPATGQMQTTPAFVLVDLNTGRPVADFSRTEEEGGVQAVFPDLNSAYKEMREVNVKKSVIGANNMLDALGIAPSRGAINLAMSVGMPDNRAISGGFISQFLPREKRIGLSQQYTPEEAKRLLKPASFNEMMQNASQLNDPGDVLQAVIPNVLEINPQKRSITASKLKQLGKTKNLDIDPEAKPFKDFAKFWTGTANWTDMSNGQRLYLMSQIGRLSPLTQRAAFPNLFPRQYNRDQFEQTVALIAKTDEAGKTPTVSVKDIEQGVRISRTAARQIFDDLITSGRARPVSSTKLQLVKSEEQFKQEQGDANQIIKFINLHGYQTFQRLRDEIIRSGSVSGETFGIADNELVNLTQAAIIRELNNKTLSRIERPLQPPPQPPKVESPEVQAEAENLAARTEEAVAQGADPNNELVAERFSNALTSALNKVGLAKLVQARVETDKTKSEIGKALGSEVSAWFDPINREIVVRMPESMNRPDITEAEIVDYANQMLNHEVIHAMREADLITEAEWNTLKNFVRNVKLNKEYLKDDPLFGKLEGDSLLENVRRRYGKQRISEEKILEEAIAEAYRLWNKHGGKFAAGKPQSIFKKILNYIKSFASAFKESGATNAEQIFSAIASGQIGQRTPGLSVFNPSADAAIRSLRLSDVADSKVRQQVKKEGKGGVKKFGATKPADSEVSQAISESEPLSERDDAFNKLADMQRGKPEMAMLVVQDTLKKEPYYSTRGNGSLNYLVEHVGDLTHRMAEKYATMPGSDMGIEYVEPKLRSAVRILSNRIDIQLLNEFPEMPELARYADEHRKLPVYNEAQRLARDAAVAIGDRNFILARDNLQKLKGMVDNGTYPEEASKYSPIKEARISDANRQRVNDVVDFQIENTAPGYIPRYNPNAPEAATLAAIEFENDGREREMPQFALSLAISNINNEDVNNPVIENSLDRHARIKSDNRTWGQKTLDLLDAGLSDFGRKFRKEMVDKYNEFRRQETELIGTENEQYLMAETSASGMLGTIDRIQGIVAAMIRNGGIRWVTGDRMITREAGLIDDKLAGYHEIDTSVPGLLSIFEKLQDGTVPNGMRQFKLYAMFKRIQGFRTRADIARRELAEMGEQMTPDDRRKRELAIEMEKKARLIDNPSNEEISSVLEQIETQYPDVATAHQQYQDWNRTLINFSRDTQILTDEMADMWGEWADYFPFYKELEESIANGQGYKKKSSLLRSDFLFEELTKDAKDLQEADPFEMIMKNASGVLLAGFRNMAALRIMRNSVEVGEARLIDGPNPRKQAQRIRKNGGYVQSVLDKGNELLYEISDPLLYESMMNFSEPAFNQITKIFAMPAGVLREMVTREPGFILLNTLRDSVSAWVTSPVGFTPIIDSFRNWNSDEMQQLEAQGIIGGYDAFRDPKDLVKYVAKQYRLRGIDVRNHSQGNMALVSRMWEALGNLSQKSDGAVRAAVYKAVLAETGSEAQARLAAIDVINFSRRGSNPIWRFITASIPFLNARVQGLDKLYTTLAGRYSPYDGIANPEMQRNIILKRAMMRLGMITAMTGLYFLMMQDNEDYKKTRKEVREDNWLISTGIPGVSFKMPMPYEVGMISKAIPEIFFNYMAGNLDARGARDSLVRQINNVTNIDVTGFQIFKPIVDIMQNKDSYTKKEIIPYWVDRGVDRLEQYDDRTTEIAKGLARGLNAVTGLAVSPMWIDYVASGYGGSLGTTLLLTADKIVREGMGDKTAGTRADWTDPNNLPVIRRFFLNMGTAGSGMQQQFYEIREEVRKSIGTLNKMKTEGRVDEYLTYQAANRDLLDLQRSVNSIDQYLKRYRNYRKQIIDSDMPSDQKRALLRELEADKDLRLTVVPVLRDEANLPVKPVSAIFEAFIG